MKKVALMPYLRSSARMRGTATAPNSPRDTKLGVVRPRAMSPYIVSKSKVTQTRWRGIAASFREPAGSIVPQLATAQRVLEFHFEARPATVEDQRVADVGHVLV